MDDNEAINLLMGQQACKRACPSCNKVCESCYLLQSNEKLLELYSYLIDRLRNIDTK